MLLIIQGTPFCNIDCTYCYLPDRDRRDRLSIDTLHRLVGRLVEFVEETPVNWRERILKATPREPASIAVVWHAGEPLVLPVRFYEDAFAAFAPLKHHGVEISHGFQTNGTLITDQWIDFFRRTNVSIGVSIDGPRDLHDRHRRYRNGSGSFERCFAGIQRLQIAQIPFHVIAVLTEPALYEPDRMFAFFLEAELYDIGFNIEEIEGRNDRSSLANSNAAALYRGFLRRFLYLNAQAGFPIRLREAEQMTALVLKGELPSNTQTEAGHILSVDVTGNVSTFSPELLGLKSDQFADFIIGNVFTASLTEMLTGPIATSLATEISLGVARCQASCDFFAFCKGGSPVNKFCETGSFRASETMHCGLTVKATLQECVDTIYGSLIDRPLAVGRSS
jgi:uncharacterized protein